VWNNVSFIRKFTKSIVNITKKFVKMTKFFVIDRRPGTWPRGTVPDGRYPILPVIVFYSLATWRLTQRRRIRKIES